MKSRRIICILLFLCSVYNYAFVYNDIASSKLTRSTLDSLYSSYIQIQLNKDNAKRIIQEYTALLNNKIELKAEDFKILAESYTTLDDTENAIVYLDMYIKHSYDTKILYSELFRPLERSDSFRTLKETYLPKLNAWILFFIFSGIVGIFISLMINLRKKGDTMANVLIGLFVLFHSFFILHLSLYLTNYVYHVPHSFWATITFSFLYGPLLYFYFKRISEGHTFKLNDFIHFLPTIAILLYFIPVYLLPVEVKQFKLFNVDASYINALHAILILKSISLIFYSFFIYRIYVNQTKGNNKVDKQNYIWQRNISYLNILYALTYSIYAFIVGSNVVFDRSKSVMLYSQIFVLALIVLYVAYTAYVQPRVFSKKYLFNESPLKYLKSGLTEDYSYELKEQLLTLLNNEKVYRLNDLNLNSLSERMGVTRHNLSQVINEHFNVNFFNLINRYRIQEAQEILKNDYNRNLNIIDIAYDVGFNNKVTFNKAFKEETNLTPTQYIHTVHSLHLG